MHVYMIHRLLSWILVRDAGDSSLVGMKDKNGYTAAAHAGMGKTVRYIHSNAISLP